MACLVILSSGIGGILIALVLALTAAGTGFYLLQKEQKHRKALAERVDLQAEEIEKNRLELESRWKLLVESKETLAQKENDLKQSKLERLNYELSPHAFKNTLNTIKGFSARTHMAVEKLTEILDYMLYDTKNNSVKLEQEIEFLETFIDLNKLMFPPWVKIESDFDTLPASFTKQMAIAPLIMVYFAENAFKHADQNDKQSFIRFSLKRTGDDILEYRVVNMRQVGVAPKPRSGIGTRNLEERLGMLFPDRFELDRQIADNRYQATLTLKLLPHEDSMPFGG